MVFTWTGPFRISDLLSNCLCAEQAWPPASDAVYLVSRHHWTSTPTSACRPLYGGGCTGDSERFCTRVGDLVADMHGFFDGNTGHHSGGQKLYEWCKANDVKPGDLYIAWATRRPWCDRCAETELYDAFVNDGLLNARRPPSCKKH